MQAEKIHTIRSGQQPFPPEVFSIWDGRDIPFYQSEDENVQEKQTFTAGNIELVHDVRIPTLIHYPASGTGPHPAVVVCPGGGYGVLAIKHEGVDVCAWLNSIGVSAFLLKYRIPDRREAAHADATRAIRYIRANAEKFQVAPDKIGIMGFSAGGHLSAITSAPANTLPYPLQDAIDQVSGRPDFAMLIYPAYLVSLQGFEMELGSEFQFNNAPPMFLIQTEDDEIKVENVLAWYIALRRAGVQAEMHIFPVGSHGYGMLRQGNPVNDWPELARQWLKGIVGIR